MEKNEVSLKTLTWQGVKSVTTPLSLISLKLMMACYSNIGFLHSYNFSIKTKLKSLVVIMQIYLYILEYDYDYYFLSLPLFILRIKIPLLWFFFGE